MRCGDRAGRKILGRGPKLVAHHSDSSACRAQSNPRPLTTQHQTPSRAALSNMSAEEVKVTIDEAKGQTVEEQVVTQSQS